MTKIVFLTKEQLAAKLNIENPECFRTKLDVWEEWAKRKGIKSGIELEREKHYQELLMENQVCHG